MSIVACDPSAFTAISAQVAVCPPRKSTAACIRGRKRRSISTAPLSPSTSSHRRRARQHTVSCSGSAMDCCTCGRRSLVAVRKEAQHRCGCVCPNRCTCRRRASFCTSSRLPCRIMIPTRFPHSRSGGRKRRMLRGVIACLAHVEEQAAVLLDNAAPGCSASYDLKSARQSLGVDK